MNRHRNSLALLTLVLVVAAFAGCATIQSDHLQADSPRAQLFEGLGDYEMPISMKSPDAQAYFKQGIAWLHAFNHDEAIRSFARAAELDPASPMPWWAIALAEGPNYNDPVMTKERTAAAWAAMQEALARIDNASPKERALIEALSTRYSRRYLKDRKKYEEAYAEAMAGVWRAYPDDPDIGAMYAEAVMVKTPWALYDVNSEPIEETPGIVATLERVLEMAPGHPGANHLYIHAVEPSKNPDRAIPAADRLATQMPGAGHLNHMPSHIYVLVGQWDKSIKQNALAMEADDVYRKLSPDQGIQHMYMVHNAHMLAYSAMMVGREKEAMDAARAMWANVPKEVLAAVAGYVDMWMTSVYDVQKRFGRWDALLAEPGPPDFLPITNAVWHAHRAVAHAAKKEIASAEKEYQEFLKAKAAIPEDSVFGPDLSHRILEVSDFFVRGEIALQKGDLDMAAQLLERAVEIEDTLSYGEPPQWLQPTRHTLGAVYLAAGRFDDAERVYRDDLKKWRGNGWSLFGLNKALEGQRKLAEAEEAKKQYRASWSKADEPTTTSCKCLPGS